MALKETVFIMFFILSPIVADLGEELQEEIDKIKQVINEQVLKALDDLSTKAGKCIGCPAGWVRHGKSCYYIDDTPTKTWSAARAACKGLGADLPIITSAEENKFIGDLVFKQTTLTWGGAWIGIKRKQADDKLYWIDGTPVAGGYTSWTEGNPSNSGGNEDCGHIIGKTDPGWESHEKMWNDVNCALTASWFRKKYPVILCEKSLI
ncbi:perlucin-like protein [Montipora capricornis]|uniref:perlucin-like protein n=1 Tax=Montipora capricornis TaxID=246305 RepID=UPI0035F1A87C